MKNVCYNSCLFRLTELKSGCWFCYEICNSSYIDHAPASFTQPLQRLAMFDFLGFNLIRFLLLICCENRSHEGYPFQRTESVIRFSCLFGGWVYVQILPEAPVSNLLLLIFGNIWHFCYCNSIWNSSLGDTTDLIVNVESS